MTSDTPSSAPRQSKGRRQDRRGTPKVNTSGLYKRAVRDSFTKLDPRNMIKNPVMFLVWLGTIVTFLVTLAPDLFGPAAGKIPAYSMD